jgi:hypothetical protein
VTDYRDDGQMVGEILGKNAKLPMRGATKKEEIPNLQAKQKFTTFKK